MAKDIITVKPATKATVGAAPQDGGNKIVLFEEDPRHPGGMVRIDAGSGEVEAYPTPAVNRLLRENRLVQVGGDRDAPARAAEEEEARREAEGEEAKAEARKSGRSK